MRTQIRPAPSASAVLRAWLRVGCRSFGGGPATIFLIRQVFVEERRWITDEQFMRMWALCQLAPGVNIIAVTILIGRELHGARGVLLALLGLLLPSAAVTILITAVYAHVQHAPAMRAAVRGIVPATVGIGLAMGLSMGRTPLAASRREGAGSLAVAILLMVAAAAATAAHGAQVFAVLLACGGLGAVWNSVRGRHAAQGARQ